MNQPEPVGEVDQAQLALARQQRLRASMRKMNVPVLLVLDSINILYATGASNMTIFSTRTPARYLLLFAEGPTILFEYFGCEHLAEGLLTIDEVRAARGLCHVSSGGNPTGQAIALAAEISALVEETQSGTDCLAVDRFPYPVIDALRARGFRLSDADAVFSEARKIKLPAEVSLLREAMRRVADAAGEMEARIEPGRSEAEVWGDFHRSFIASEGKYVATRLLQSGPRSFPYFQEAGPRKLQSGELLCFDTDTIGYGGYCTDFSRTYLCGDKPASAIQKGLFARAREQLEHNLALIQPGASFREIAEAAWPVPEEHCDSRYYCMSGEFPNIPHAITGQPYPLDGEVEAGMVICVESYIGSAESGQGVKLEDQLLVGANGSECMSAGVLFDQRLQSRTF